MDRDNLGTKRNLVSELPLKALRKLIHAANGLKHRRHSRARDDRSDSIREARLQQSAEIVRVARSTGSVLLISVVCTVQIPLIDEERDETLLVLLRQRAIELILVDRFGHEFAGITDHVSFYLAKPHALIGQRPDVVALEVEVGRLVLVDENLDRHA